MTIVLLASVSLFALVVTGRPILLPDTELRSDLVPPSSVLRSSLQAPFRISSGNDITSDATRFHSQKSTQHIEYFEELGKEMITPVASVQVSSEEPHTFRESCDETLDEQDVSDANNEYNVTKEPVISGRVAEASNLKSASTPLVVLVFSCVAALLVLACVSLSLYITKLLRSKMLASKTAWELLPRFWRHPRCQEDTSVIGKHLSGGGCLLLQSERHRDAEDWSAQRPELHSGEKPPYIDAVSDIDSEWDDVDEKYQDALDMTPLPLIHDLPLEDNVSRLSHYDDPPLRPPFPLDLPMADRSSPLMREACASPSPVSRPAWSVRATDSPVLGLSSRQGGVADNPDPLVHPRRRAYRSPVPEFDVALAMQLRPGLGIGADSAWMVRFLMAIFGWFAVALTGNAP